MNNYYLFPFLILFFYILNYIFKRNNILLDKIESSKHKKFLISDNVPLSGGILILIAIIFFVNEITILDKVLFSIIFLVGLSSDLQKLKSPLVRLILQFFVILIFLILSKDFVIQIRISYFDYLLENFTVFKLLFTLFCLLILINGTNFIDGLNGLCSGYFIVVIINLLIVALNSGLTYGNNNLEVLLQFLFVFLIFNLLSKSFLGDSGSYLIGTYIGLFLIHFFDEYNNLVSPYFICLLLWYPAFENLFSISRRILRKNEVSEPDNKHLHQLIFLFIKSKEIFEDKKINSASSIIILILNLPSFVLSSLLATHSQILLFIILMNIILYILIYNFISKNLKINK